MPYAMSFRARIFFLAVTLVAVVIMLVVYAGWTSLLGHETQRLEIRLCLEARRLAGGAWRQPDMDRLVGDLLTKLDLQEPGQLAFSLATDLGETLMQTPRWEGESLSARLAWRSVANIGPSLATCQVGEEASAGRHWLWARQMGRTGKATVGVDLAAARQELRRQMGGTLGVVLTVSLVLTLLVAWLIAMAAIRPVARLRSAMRHIGPTSLDKRLTDAGEDREFRALIATYNEMLARLQASFEQASRFSADAAHELMTPLTILLGRIEEARRHEEREAVQEEWDDLLDEVSRLTAIVRKLLLLAQADSGALSIEREPVDLSLLLDELVADLQMAGTVGILASVERGLKVDADRTLLRQLLNNLLSNALRYRAASGPIRIEARRHGADTLVRVANPSHPLSMEVRSHLFDRFYRSDGARTREKGGAGLGLSLAREIALAHGGTLALDSGADDEVSLTLRLPSRG